jgi:hypothetical protein
MAYIDEGLMIKLLEEAIAEVNKLPEAQQEKMAQWILDTLRDEAKWDDAFASTQSQLEQLADKALADYLSGHTQELDVDTLE